MRLRYSLTSPFARKVRLAAATLGLPLELEIADTLSDTDTLRQQNPLGKIPTLLTDDGETLFDSRVIVAYLDQIGGAGRLHPADPKAKISNMRLEALADGLMDAGVLQLYETRFRPQERHEPTWLEHQQGKVDRTFLALEAEPPQGEGLTSGEIALACALGFFDFRFGGRWRESCPNLVAWQERFAARCPAFAETAPRLV